MSEEVKQVGEEVDEEEVVEQDSSSDETKNTEEQNAGNKIPYDRFKEKVDEVNALKNKVKEFEDAQRQKEKQDLEDKEEYKTLYEQALDEIKTMKSARLNDKKESLLSKAGYNDEQIAQLTKLVEGETDEDINSSIETLKATFPTKPDYVDPSVDNAHRQKPKTKDSYDYGRALFDRVRGK